MSRVGVAHFNLDIWSSHFPTELKQCSKFDQRSDLCLITLLLMTPMPICRCRAMKLPLSPELGLQQGQGLAVEWSPRMPLVPLVRTTRCAFTRLILFADKRKYQLGLDNVFQGLSDSCARKTVLRTLSSDAEQAIVDKHNELRRKVAKGEETSNLAWGNQPRT